MTGFRNNHFHVLIKRFGYNVHYDFFGGFKLWLWVSIWFWVRLENSLMFFYGVEYCFLWLLNMIFFVGLDMFFGFDLVWDRPRTWVGTVVGTWWDGGCLSKPYRKPYLSENQKNSYSNRKNKQKW